MSTVCEQSDVARGVIVDDSPDSKNLEVAYFDTETSTDGRDADGCAPAIHYSLAEVLRLKWRRERREVIEAVAAGAFFYLLGWAVIICVYVFW